MYDFSYIEIKLPEAQRLADLYGFSRDLTECRTYSEKYLKAYAQSADTECYLTYIFIKYGRCFKTGVRQPFIGSLPIDLSNEETETHRLIIDLRDKHIAHSVNNLEQHTVRVWLNPPELGRRINNVNIGSEYLVGVGAGLIQNLIKLLDKFLEWAEDEKKNEEARLQRLVESKYSLDELYTLGKLEPVDFDYSRVNKPRPKP